MNTDSISNLKHYGHNVKRLRDILGIKQESIASAMNMTQQNFSILEQKPEIDNDILEKIATILKIPVDAIKNFNEEGVVNIIASTNSCNVMYNPTFNAIDKIVELYEKLLAEKDKTISILENFHSRSK